MIYKRYSIRCLDRTKVRCYSINVTNPSKVIGNKILGNKTLGIQFLDKEGEELKLSTKGRYGLRALIDLAQHSENEPVSITSIASRQGISERYLEQLMSMLKKAGLIKSIRGAGGGYVLDKEMKEISVGDVLRALEGNLEPVECSGLNPEAGCSSSSECVTKYVWQRINDSINKTVDEIKLDQLVSESKELQTGSTGGQIKCNQ